MDDTEAQRAEFTRANAASLERLSSLVAKLDDDQLARVLPNGWSVAATLAHIGFWDQSLPVRWDMVDRLGVLAGVPDELDDLFNDSLLPYLAAIPPRAAAELALRSMAEADARTASLSDDAWRMAVDNDMAHLLDRSAHRDHHAEEIESAVRA